MAGYPLFPWQISHRRCGSTARIREDNSGLEKIFFGLRKDMQKIWMGFDLLGITPLEREVAASGFEPVTKGLTVP